MRLMEPPPVPPAGGAAGAAGDAAQRPPLLHTPAPSPSSSSSFAASALPFSAASLGRAPARVAATAPTGSDVLADALAEEEVARLGAQFFGGGGGGGGVGVEIGRAHV